MKYLKDFFNRQNAFVKAVIKTIIFFVVAYLLMFSYSAYHVFKGDILFQNKWYAQENLPPEATDEFWEYRKQLRETPIVRGPEETYKLFREALLAEDYDSALQYISENKKEAYKTVFEDKEQTESLAKKLPQQIEKNTNALPSEIYFDYAYDTVDGSGYYLVFKKNLDGLLTIEAF